MRAKFFADAVDEELDAAAALAAVDVEVFAVDEELAEVAQEEASAARALVEFLGADVCQPGVAARAEHGVDVG